MELPHHFRVLPGFLVPAEREALAAVAATDPEGWEQGRQRTGYDRLFLPRSRLEGAVLTALLARILAVLGDPPELQSDLYLLRYPEGARIPAHTDPPVVPGAIHLRLNAVVEQALEGGEFVMGEQEVPLAVGDAVLFRPDAVRHEVRRLTRGGRLLFSAGCNLLPREQP